MGLLEGKRILVTGGAHGCLHRVHVRPGGPAGGGDRGAPHRSLAEPGGAERQRLPSLPPVLELDVTNDEHLPPACGLRLRVHVDGLDGVVHGIAFAPQAALGGNFLKHELRTTCRRRSQVSTFSLKALPMASLPLIGRPAGAVVGLDFDATVASAGLDSMGVARRAWSRVPVPGTRPRRQGRPGEPGVRAWPAGRPMAAKSILGLRPVRGGMGYRAPLGWTSPIRGPAARACVASAVRNWSPATTGEIVETATSTGRVHAVGA